MSVSRSAFDKQRRLVGLLRQLFATQLLTDGAGDRGDALRALALGAELVVIDDLGQAGNAVGQRLLAVLVEEELGVGQARAHHALVAADHGDWHRPG